MGDGFFAKLWRGTAALVLWATHFFVSYLYAAAHCGPATRPVLALVTVLALGGAGWLLWRACRRPPSPGLLAAAEATGATLALVGIGWGALPWLVTGPCNG